MWKFILAGAAAAGLLITVRVGYTATAPGPGQPGEAAIRILGVVVNRVPIPPDPGGRGEGPPTSALVGTFAVAEACALTVGGLLGWCAWRVRRRAAEPGAAAARAGGRR
jgi:hypothetical protein